jgi:carboxyl-terminal processing protease
VAFGKKKEQILDSFSGTMAGVGCKIGRRGDEIAVIEVYPGTPAANAGLREEDRIIAIDGEPTSGHAVAEIVDRLRGPAGSSVRLSVRTPGREQPEAFEIERQRFVIPTVRSKMVGPGIGYLRVSRLSQNSGVVAERALRGIREDRGLRGLVLDLRGNSGGSMLAAGRIADQFVSGGMLIETRGAHGTPVRGLRQIAATVNPDSFEDSNLPVVVLVDKGTGSSAELLAATLAWHDRAVLVGQRTYGKPVMQKLLPIGDDLLLKLTVARSYAAGRPVPESGLEPDVIVAGPDASPGPARCTQSALDCEDAAAAVLPGPAGDADPELSVAMDIIARHPLGSRARLREAIANSLRTL